MRDVQRNEKEHVSRRQAAERLVDLAYALTTGGEMGLSSLSVAVWAAACS